MCQNTLNYLSKGAELCSSGKKNMHCTKQKLRKDTLRGRSKVKYLDYVSDFHHGCGKTPTDMLRKWFNVLCYQNRTYW